MAMAASRLATLTPSTPPASVTPWRRATSTMLWSGAAAVRFGAGRQVDHEPHCDALTGLVAPTRPDWKRGSIMRFWSSKSGRVRRVRVQYNRPRVEALEDRTLLSFIAAPTYPVAGADAIAVGDFN